jgi:hypothetical protein
MKNSHCRDPKMEAYCDEVRRLEDKFYGLELNHIARRYNETADELAKIASGRTTVPPDVFSRDLHQPSIKIDDTPEPEAPSAQPEVPSAQSEASSARPEAPSAWPEPPSVQPEAPSAPEGEALRVEEERSGVTPNQNWQTPYLQYLHRGELPLDRAEARRLARRAESFVLLGDGKELYHRSPSGILQRCISITEGQELLREIHSGACGHHAAPRALVGNAFRQGFYWPTAVADATRIVRTCEGCQFYARQTHLPAQALQTIPITWPFAVWGHVVSQAYVPSGGSERTLSHGVKTTRPCSVPRTARARATTAPRTTRPVALTPRRDRRRLWQEKQATLRLRHNDRVKKGTPRRSISYPFPFFLFLSLTTGTGKGGYPEKDPSP